MNPPTRASPRRRARARTARVHALAVLAVVAALTTGCATTNTPGATPMDPRTSLAARVTSGQAVARYEQMQKRIRDELDAAIGPFPWKITGKGTRSGCGGEFAATDGRVVYLDPWGFDTPIPDTDWPRARHIIGTITAEYGFTTAGIQIDNPGHHITGGVDTTLDAYYDFGTNLATDMQITTGCHHPA